MALVNIPAAVAAYGRSLSATAIPSGTEAIAGRSGVASPSFGSTLQRALEGVVDAGQAADTAATRAVTGGGDVTQVVTAVAKAELALQTTVAIRDRVIAAYQEVMRMPI